MQKCTPQSATTASTKARASRKARMRAVRDLLIAEEEDMDVSKTAAAALCPFVSFIQHPALYTKSGVLFIFCAKSSSLANDTAEKTDVYPSFWSKVLVSLPVLNRRCLTDKNHRAILCDCL